jgi:ribonuclease PH
LRADGRAPHDLRPVKLTPDFIPSAEGSVLIEAGQTRIIVTATVDDGVPPFLKGKGKGWVTGEYGMLPRSTEERTPREATRGRQSGRTLEIQRLIGRTLRAVTDTAALGERTVWLDCDVIQADGGTRTASITGGFIALHQCVRFMCRTGMIAKSAIKDHVAAVSCGICQGAPVLDLDYAEDSTAETDANFVLTGSGGLVEIQGTAEGAPFTDEQFAALLKLARKGIGELIALQQQAIG